jgi:hypothetical protein
MLAEVIVPGAVEEDVEQKVTREIRRYLDAHPDAADTIDGVLQWWLSPESASASRETVHRALARLIASGDVKSRVLVDGAVVYARR